MAMRQNYTVQPGQHQVKGRLKAVRLEKRKGQYMWLCECDCGSGREVWARPKDFFEETKIACRCLQIEAMKVRNEANGVQPDEVYGALKVISTYVVGEGKDSERYAICACACGRGESHHRCGDLRPGPSREGVRMCRLCKADLTSDRMAELGIKVEDRFDRWLVLETFVQGTKKERFGLCRCNCGTIRVVAAHNLRTGASRSCGCLHREAVRDYWMERGVQAGDVFEWLTVDSIYFSGGPRSHRRAKVTCRCTKPKDVVANSLLQGLTKSCGCQNQVWLHAGRRRSARLNRIRRGIHPSRRLMGFNQGIWDICRVPFRQVRLRDGYRCQLCLKRGGYLEVHHIIKKSTCLALVVVAENMVTLCRGCHEKVHRGNYRAETDPLLSKILAACAVWAQLDCPADFDEMAYLQKVQALKAAYVLPEAG